MDEKKLWKNNADISWIDKSRPMVAICFDDGPVGPDKKNLPVRIHKSISENGFHATFFYTVNLWDREFGDDQKKEIADAQKLGFEIANHTWSHKDLSKISSEEIKNELEGCSRALNEITGLNDFLIRPPYLNISEDLQNIAQGPLVTCSVDTFDWDNASADSIFDLLIQKMNDGVLENAIVLMHEVYEETVQAVERIMPVLKEKGWQQVTVAELFKANGIEMYSGQIYEHA